MSVDLIRTVLERHANECAEQEHVSCSGRKECELALHSYEQGSATARPEPFDASEILLSQGAAWPDERWPTAALLKLVKDSILDAPYRDPLRRSLLITSSLARLAERGIPADAVVRTALGPTLIRKILVQVSAIWILTESGRADRAKFARVEPWLSAIDVDPAIKELTKPSTPDVAIAAIHGLTGRLARKWVSSASITHIIGWRLGDHLTVEITEDERVLPAGTSATQWIVDRFTETYLDAWSKTSLEWELVFLHNPRETSSKVGLPPALLAERSTELARTLEALARRLSGAVGDDPVSAGLRPGEVVETIVGLLRDGDIEEAQGLASEAVERAPDSVQLRNALAFCLMPTDSAQARAEFGRLVSHLSEHERVALKINETTLALAAGNPSDASDLLREVRGESTEGGGWFWDPLGTIDARHDLIYLTFTQWHKLAHLAIQALSERDAD